MFFSFLFFSGPVSSRRLLVGMPFGKARFRRGSMPFGPLPFTLGALDLKPSIQHQDSTIHSNNPQPWTLSESNSSFTPATAYRLSGASHSARQRAPFAQAHSVQTSKSKCPPSCSQGARNLTSISSPGRIRKHIVCVVLLRLAFLTPPRSSTLMPSSGVVRSMASAITCLSNARSC